MKIKISFFLLLTLLSCKIYSQDTILYVTEVQLSYSSNSLDSVIYQAITEANAGKDVVVMFNASGLVQIDDALPPISITNGSIVLKRYPQSIYNQGIQFASDDDNDVIQYGFVLGNTPNTSITIDSLTIRDFPENPNEVYRFAVIVSDTADFIIKNCHFENNNTSIFVYSLNASNTKIFDNEFINDQNSISVNVVNGSTEIYDNVFTDTTLFYEDWHVSISVNNYFPQVANYYDLKLKRNEINSLSTNKIGVYFSHINEVDSIDLLSVDIVGNEINTHSYGIYLNQPRSIIKLDSNIINTDYVGLMLEGNSESENNLGFKLIAENSIGLDVFNGHNIFNSIQGHTIKIEDDIRNVQIVGQQFYSRIDVNYGINPIVRETRIKSNISPDDPLHFNNNDNGIASPIISYSNKNDDTLRIYYYLSGNGIVQDHAEFIVEFFESNQNGDLIRFIGRQSISNLDTAIYVCELLDTLNVDYTRIAATVTGLSTLSQAEVRGSSMASYKTVIVTETCRECKFLNFCLPDKICVNIPFTVINSSENCSNPLPDFMWNYGDGAEISNKTSHTYTNSGEYTITLFIPENSSCPRYEKTLNVVVTDCSLDCKYCIGSFSPIPGKKYVLSAWTIEDNAPNTKASYTYPKIEVVLTTPSGIITVDCLPSGKIIDGWQRIEQEFELPQDATNIELRLICETGDCFFDDVRVFPEDGSMKSYVYDPITLRLVAELDENNYATFYEYDEEGKLIRVKKETERGIMTIKENRNSFRK